MKKYPILLAVLLTAFVARTASAQSELKDGPKGIVCLVKQHLNVGALAADPGWTNPNVKGFLVREEWKYIEPKEGTFNWTLFNEAVTLGAKYHKFVGLSVCAGALCPEWIYTEGATQFFFTPPSEGRVTPIPEPWDPVFLSFWNGLITSFGQNFDGNASVAYVVMTGPGRDYEMNYATEPLDVANFELMDGQALWNTAAVQIAGAYVAAFPHTHLLYAMSPPTPDAAGAETIQSVITTLFQSYPHQFGVACASLAPTTDGTIPSVSFIQSQSSQATVGFQMFAPASVMAVAQASTSHASAETIMLQSLAKAALYNAHYVEVYTQDCRTAAQQSNFVTADTSLTAISTASSSP